MALISLVFSGSLSCPKINLALLAMLAADPSQSGPRFTILSGDSRLRLTLRWRAHYGIY
jgi:hypothetical protein